MGLWYRHTSSLCLISASHRSCVALQAYGDVIAALGVMDQSAQLVRQQLLFNLTQQLCLINAMQGIDGGGEGQVRRLAGCT